MNEPLSEQDLEQRFRESLERHARDAGTSVVVPKRRRSLLVPLAAAAAVAAAVTTGVVLLRDGDTTSDGPPLTGEPTPEDWRTESWHGVQVSVPADWGWGGGPMKDTEGPLACGLGAAVTPKGGRRFDPDIGYVGRPVYLTDVCEMFDSRPRQVPTAPYVWFDAPFDPGTTDLGDGWQEQTVKVGGVTITAGTDDPELREQLLASARRNDGSVCEPTLDGWPGAKGGPVDSPTGADICVYDRDEDGGQLQLLYVTHIGAPRAARFEQAFRTAPDFACTDTYSRQWALIRVHGAGGTQDLSAPLDDCTLIASKDKAVEFTEATVEPWAVDGIAAYVTGPFDPDNPELMKYFRGPQG